MDMKDNTLRSHCQPRFGAIVFVGIEGNSGNVCNATYFCHQSFSPCP